MLGRDSGLPTSARSTAGTSGYVPEGTEAPEGSSSAIFRNSKTPISPYSVIQLEGTEKALGQVKEVMGGPQDSSGGNPESQPGIPLELRIVKGSLGTWDAPELLAVSGS